MALTENKIKALRVQIKDLRAELARTKKVLPATATIKASDATEVSIKPRIYLDWRYFKLKVSNDNRLYETKN